MPQENDEELDPMSDGPPDPDLFTLEEYDHYVSEKIKMPLVEEEFIATVMRRKRNINGKPIAISDKNPLLNKKLYEV